jgi:hypothetical protein
MDSNRSFFEGLFGELMAAAAISSMANKESSNRESLILATLGVKRSDKNYATSKDYEK